MFPKVFYFYNLHRFIIVLSDNYFLEPTGEIREITMGLVPLIDMLLNFETQGDGFFL